MKITKEDILNYEKLYRTKFVNSLSGFKSGCLIGTKSKKGNTNLAVFSSVIHVGANPPAIGLLMRPVPAERDTYTNIKESWYFTINHINRNFYKQAHQTSARYSSDQSEFEMCNLTEEYSNGFTTPYVKESKIKIGVKFIEEHQIEFNSTIFIVGEIVEIILDEDIIRKDGYLDIEKAGTVAISSLDSYHTTNRLARLSYAKPGKEVIEITY